VTHRVFKGDREGRLSLVTAPAEEPLSTDDAKTHLRVDHSSEDTYIAALVESARLDVERHTGRALVTQTWDLKLRRFPAGGIPIRLPKAPLQSITSISYVDANGTTQTWDAANYSADAPAGEFADRGLLVPDYGVIYPATQGHIFDVTVRLVAGYGAAAAVPEGLVEAVRLLVAHRYDTRTPVVTGTVAARIPDSVQALLNAYALDPVAVA